MILLTLECKWKSKQREVLEKINEITYFNKNRRSIEYILDLIEDKSIKNKLLQNGSFCDEDENCKTIILFLAGSGKIMELRIQCYDEYMDNVLHVIAEKEKILNYIKQQKICRLKFIKRKILSKVKRDELKIESVEFVYKKISKILGVKALTPIYFSSLSLIVPSLINFFTDKFIADLYFLLFFISIPLNLIVIMVINYLGGKKYAYQI